jgi:hypothetical protein
VAAPAHGPGDAVTAALLLITEHAERLAAVDQREAGHYREIAARLAELTRQASQVSGTTDQVRAVMTRHTAILDSLDGLDQQVAALASRLTDIAPARAYGNGVRAHGHGAAAHSHGDPADKDEDGSQDQDGASYAPAPTAQWWKLSGEERQEVIARLRAWVDQVYRPGYGHLAAALGSCWEQHPLCLYGLDWLVELWSVLYLTGERGAAVLASQAELQTRLLPALAEQMQIETTGCEHAQPAPGSHHRPTQAGPPGAAPSRQRHAGPAFRQHTAERRCRFPGPPTSMSPCVSGRDCTCWPP